MFVQVASRLAVGDILEEVVDGIRLGRLTALAKPDGGVRGIVDCPTYGGENHCQTGREEGRESHCSFQYALSSKAGCECGAHIVQAVTDQDVNATVVTVDGVGAYDLISRNAMLEGLFEDGRRGSDPPVRTIVLRDPVHVSVGE